MRTPHSPKQDFWTRTKVRAAINHQLNQNHIINIYLFPIYSISTPLSNLSSHPPLYTQLTKTQKKTVMLHFRPGPSTPPLRSGQKYKMSSSLHFDAVVKFLRKKLALQPHESVFCYVNQVFAPGLDEGVGNLWRCFKTGEELVISYCVAQSFG
jgi:ubiquitin-like protein ATG12